MALEVLIPKGFAETSTLLVGKLKELGVDVHAHYTFKGTKPSNVTARVCWGLGGYAEIPELNTKSGHWGKLSELRQFKANSIPCPEYWTVPPEDAASYPILARQSSHAEGKDIVVCEDKTAALRATASFYTRLIPSTTEYRVWVFRRTNLGVYERKLDHKPTSTGFGRNWATGYGYTRLWEGEDDIPWAAVDYAKEAIAALKYDFGAVDILKGENGRYHVLECNTAPSAEAYCQRALRLLAENVRDWYSGIK